MQAPPGALLSTSAPTTAILAGYYFQGRNHMSSETADPRRWIALILLTATQFMLIIDVSIVNVALPTIERDLHFTDSSLQWVASAYALTFGGFLLLGGRCADLLGRRRLFMAGLAVFTIASLACGFAQHRTTC